MKSFILWRLRQILTGWSKKRGWDGLYVARMERKIQHSLKTWRECTWNTHAISIISKRILGELWRKQTHPTGTGQERMMGFCECGNESDSSDNKLCSTKLWHLVVPYVFTNYSVKRSTFIFTVEVTYEGWGSSFCQRLVITCQVTWFCTSERCDLKSTGSG